MEWSGAWSELEHVGSCCQDWNTVLFREKSAQPLVKAFLPAMKLVDRLIPEVTVHFRRSHLSLRDCWMTLLGQERGAALGEELRALLGDCRVSCLFPGRITLENTPSS